MEFDKIIQRSSFEMFRDWTKLAKARYPNLDFTIIDETELVEDTKESLTYALKSLFSSEYEKERQNQSWCIGFVDGFIKGHLKVAWFHEYYQKQTDNYRYMAALKGILDYYKVDSNISWRLDAIYKAYFKSHNLENFDFLSTVDLAFLKKYAPNTNLRTGIVEQLLDNIIIMFIKNMVNESSFAFPDKNYFTDGEIRSFIENRHKFERS